MGSEMCIRDRGDLKQNHHGGCFGDVLLPHPKLGWEVILRFLLPNQGPAIGRRLIFLTLLSIENSVNNRLNGSGNHVSTQSIPSVTWLNSHIDHTFPIRFYNFANY